MKKIEVENLITCLHQFNIDVELNELYLVGEEGYISGGGDDSGSEPGVEYLMANRLIKNIHLVSERLKEKNKYKPLIVHMKTDGGYVTEGMAIYDALKACPNPVTIVNYSHASSMSSIIFQAAHRRIMMPHSCFMFHWGSYSMSGTFKQVESSWEFDKRDNNIMLEIYATRMKERGLYKNKSKTFIKDWLIKQMEKRVDVFLTADEAIKYGLADEIFSSWRNVRK